MAGHAELDADLILAHSGFIRSLARGLIRDEALVEDVVQETLVTALEKGPRRREALVAWLRTVTRNIAFKTYRGTARRRAREEDAAQSERLDATVDIVARSEALESLTDAVLELPEGAREVIFLRYYEGLSHAEIGEKLGVAPGAVRMRVHRAQRLVKERLDRTSGGDRVAWMSGLAGLVGVPLSKIQPVGGGESVATPTMSTGAMVAWATVAALGLSVLGWFGLRPSDSALEAPEEIARMVDPVPEATSTLTAAADDRDRTRESLLSNGLGSGGERDLVDEVGAIAEEEVEFPEGNLVGTVVDHLGRPVGNARISAAWGRSPMEFRVHANEEGRFGIHVPPKLLDDARNKVYSILLCAAADDHAPSRVHAYPYEGVEPNSDGERVLLKLRGPGGSFEGRVLAPDGRPLGGATIELGERRRLGIGFLGQQSAEAENMLAPHLATTVEIGTSSVFQGHRSMRGTLGIPVIDNEGTRARLPPAGTRTSKPDGYFKFGGLESGRRRIRITHPGCAPWTGHVAVDPDREGVQVFRMERGAVVRGTVRREDGIPITTTLVHAITQDPYSVVTVKTDAEGQYVVKDLPPKDVRIVAEEREIRGGHTPTNIAELAFRLGEGEVRDADLEMHAPLSARVRVVVHDGETRRPMPDMRIEVRAQHNPLLLLAAATTNETGLAQVPMDTVVPAKWMLTQSILRRRPGDTRGVPVETPIRFLDAPDEIPRSEIVVTLEPSDLRPVHVKLEPVVPDSPPLGLIDGVQLISMESPHTFTGWPTEKTGVLAFYGVPPGRYRVLYPHHGLGWISPFPLDIRSPGSGEAQDLGRIDLPRLGALALRPSTEAGDAPSWHDLTIRAIIEGRRGTVELAVFSGRVQLPTEIPIAPGRYRVSHGRGDPGEEVWITGSETVTRLWD